MAPKVFTWKSTIPLPVEEVFNWHTRPGAFDRLNAPWRPVRVIKAPSSLMPGEAALIRLPVAGPISIPWHIKHSHFVPNSEFNDEQIAGPLLSWHHRHRFLPGPTEASTTMLDEITYELPVYARPFSAFFERELSRLFAFRHARLAADLSLHQRWADKPRKRILIAGASGFIGSALSSFLSTGGHSVFKLVRRKPTNPHERFWDPREGILDPNVFADIDVVINLAGEPLLGRWTEEKKRNIKESRVVSAELLSRAIAQLSSPPAVAIMASAVGIYGNTRDHLVNESTRAGHDFLADVCKAWETASHPIAESSCRLVHLRIGTVLNAAGGALQKMLPAFSLGLGGPVGSGNQYMSWIALEDLVGVIEHSIYSSTLSGAVNAVTPNPCTNREFTKALGRVLRRPTLIPMPKIVLQSALGEVADALLLSSTRVEPRSLIQDGYSFLFPHLEAALRFECGKV